MVQEGILFHSLAAGALGAHVEQVHATLAGPLDVDWLRVAWQAVVDVHPICGARW